MLQSLLRRSTAAVIAAAGCVSAFAGSVTLQSSLLGSQLTINVLDESPGAMILTLGGAFDLSYDKTAFVFNSAAYPTWVAPATDPLADVVATDNSGVAPFGDDTKPPPDGLFTVSFLMLAEPDLSDETSPHLLFSVLFDVVGSASGSYDFTLTGAYIGLSPFDVTNDFPVEGYMIDGPVSSPVTIASPVPEPSAYALMAAGLAGIGFAARRRARQDA